MYYHWGCTSIYWPLSYPFRCLHSSSYYLKKGYAVLRTRMKTESVVCVCLCVCAIPVGFMQSYIQQIPNTLSPKLCKEKKWQFLFFLSPYLSFLSCYIFQTSVPLSTSFPYTPLCVLVSPRFPTSRRIFTSVYDKVREKPVIVQTVIS